MVYPANQLELIETFKIPRMQLADGNGQRFIGCVFAAVNDMLVEACATLIRAALLYDVNPTAEEFGYEQPFAAIELLGQESGLPLYPGELHSSLVTQLRRKWDHYSGGIRDAMLSELERAGYDAIISTPVELDLTPQLITTGNQSATTAGATVSVSGLVIAGDLLLLQVETANEPIARPAGWDDVASVGVGAAAAGGTRLQVFKRFAESEDEPDVVIPDPGDHLITRMIVVRGAGVSVDASIGVSADADVTAVSVDASNAEVDQCLVLLLLATGADASGGQVSAQANADLTDVTEEVDNGSTTGNGGGTSVTSGLKALAGSCGTWTATLGTAARWAGVSLTIAPLQYWSRFWVGVLNSPFDGPGLSWGAHRVGLDRLGPSAPADVDVAAYLSTLKSIVARNKHNQFIPWEYAFPLADGSGTIRIPGSARALPFPVYFS